MRILRSLAEWPADVPDVVFAAGAFDGVHRGHLAVLDAARALASGSGAAAWVLTFEPHPQKVLRPNAAPSLLTSTAQRLEVFRAAGMAGCLLIPFTPELARQEPEAFLAGVRGAVPTLRGIVCGENWRFGHAARGDAHLLRGLGAGLGFAAVSVPRLRHGGHPISSSRIRSAVVEGRVEDAAGMLGRPFAVRGTVIEGRRIGRQMGFPTANIRPENEVRPGAGIYAARIGIDGASRAAAVYRGPGAAGEDIVEVHVLDFAGDLYGRTLEVSLLHRVREDRRFFSLAELAAQIALDIVRIRELLAAPPR